MAAQWRSTAPAEVKYRVEIPGQAGVLLFSGTIGLEGCSASDELTYDCDLLNAYTEQPVTPLEIERRLPIPVPNLKLGSCVVHFQPRPPWKRDGGIRFHGTIDGSSVTPYMLLLYIRDGNGNSQKHRITLVP